VQVLKQDVANVHAQVAGFQPPHPLPICIDDIMCMYSTTALWACVVYTLTTLGAHPMVGTSHIFLDPNLSMQMQAVLLLASFVPRLKTILLAFACLDLDPR
jgi:hypothetical protein